MKTPGLESSRVLYILRGLPGSGKSQLGKKIMTQSRGGEVFSTDDFFYNEDNE